MHNVPHNWAAGYSQGVEVNIETKPFQDADAHEVLCEQRDKKHFRKHSKFSCVCDSHQVPIPVGASNFGVGWVLERDD